MTELARGLWQRYEPYHALTYFARESRAAYAAAGLAGFWDGYFAGRAAPLGPAGPGTVTAIFQGFAPPFVARRVPAVWSVLTPEAALGARLEGMDGALRRLIVDAVDRDAIDEAAQLARRAVDGCAVAGRALFAANAELAWPAEPHLALWHASTLLREHRGDGHVVALTAAGLDSCESHVVRLAGSGESPEWIQKARGWTADDWAAAGERLRARGWLDGDGLTAHGWEQRDEIEVTTDRLAHEPLDRLGDTGCARLLELLTGITRVLAAAEAIPYPNPIGLTPPA